MAACSPLPWLLLLPALAGGLLFFLYPLWLLLAGAWRRERRHSPLEAWPSLSILVVVRNGEKLVRDKVANLLACRYPAGKKEILFHSDASDDGTETLLADLGVAFTASREHLGKNQGLNVARAAARGEILVFSDADALLEVDALEKLVAPFADPAVGGVCGQRVIRKETAALTGAQGRYIRFDSAIKSLESRLGRLTSNDGKLYAIRAAAFRAIPDGVTDDLYNALTVIGQGYRFVFEPEARAGIATPSRSPGHELCRRRRIVARGLHGIFLHRRLLNPLRFGGFALGLLVNKVVRRLLPVFMILLGAATLAGLGCHPLFWPLFLGQGLFYGLALLHPLLPPWAGRRLETPYYFCLGNLGALLGLWDAVRGRHPARWDPVKG